MAAYRLPHGVAVLLLALAAQCSASAAEFKQCERLTPDQQLQADFCSAHVACRVAIDMLNTCVDVTEALRKFYATLSNSKSSVLSSPEISEREERERALEKLDSMPAAERKARLAACMARNGDSGIEVCYEGFAGTEERAARRLAEQAKIPNVSWPVSDREDIRRFNADDLSLINSMWDAKCTTPGVASFSQCELLGRRAVELKRSVERFERTGQARPAPDTLALAVPDLRSWAMIRVGADGAATYVMDPPRLSAGGAKAPAEVAAAPGEMKSPSLPNLVARAPTATEALFAEEIAKADVIERPREALEAQARAQRETQARAAAAAASAAAQRTDAAAQERRIQELADDQVMRNGSVGQVFALGDRLESEQHPDAARKAYRAVVARFPDHALAGSAVTRLSAITAAPPAQMAPVPRVGAGGAAGNGAVAVTGNCEALATALNAELDRLNASRPANTSSITGLTVVMYVTSRSLALGNGACKGSRREGDLTVGMQAAYDAAKKNCETLSSNPSTCVPRSSW